MGSIPTDSTTQTGMGMGKFVYIRNKKIKPGNNGWWSDKQKTKAVATYLSTGSLPLTAAMENIPYATLARWRQAEWWREITQQLQDEDNQQMDSKVKKILEKSMQAVEDRIENGDFLYDSKTGVVKRVPAKLRDVQKVTSDLFDRRLQLQKQKTQTSTNEIGVADRLAKIAEQFAALALGKKVEEKVVNEYIEGEFEHAVHEDKNL